MMLTMQHPVAGWFIVSLYRSWLVLEAFIHGAYLETSSKLVGVRRIERPTRYFNFRLSKSVPRKLLVSA